MRVLGLISGTSVDGVDGAIVSLTGQGYDVQVDVIGGGTVPYPPALRQRILAVCAGESLSLEALADLDDAIATQFARVAHHFMATYGAVDLIGSHGQTVFHRPKPTTSASLAYSLQLGRGEAIAHQTHCPVVSHFRQADIAAGGEGAPLVPPVDLALLSHPSRWRCIQNIGGIGNVTVLPPWDRTVDAIPPKVLGWDTGPGNSLLDLAVEHFSQGEKTYDENGQWAATGTPHAELLETWLRHPYFAQLPPKSTGRELFGKAFLENCCRQGEALALTPADLLATLTELTARSIADSYHQCLPRLPDDLLLCGGGCRNQYLVERLRQYLPTVSIAPTTDFGVPADLKEAIAFAVLAYWRYQSFPGNLPSVTGAAQAVLLGQLHFPVSSSSATHLL